MTAVATRPQTQNPVQSLVADYDTITTCTDLEWLTEQLEYQFRLTTEHLARLAVLAVRVEQLGGSLPQTPMRFLRKIANGLMHPQTYLAFEDAPHLMRIVSELPVSQQQSIANGETLEVYVYNADNAADHVLLPVQSMTRQQLDQVFTGGRLRTHAEQVNFLREREQPARIRRTETQPPYTINRRSRKAIIGGREFTVQELLQIVSELS